MKTKFFKMVNNKRISIRRSKKKSSVPQQIQKYLRKNAERKFFDTTVSSAVDITWDVTTLSQTIVQGIGGGQRIGDNITYVALTMIGRFTINPAAAVSNCRMVVVLDKMNDGIAPIYSDLFINNGIDSTYSVQQIKEKRFTILLDKSYALNLQGIAAHMFNHRMPLNQKVEYNATTSVVGANGKNSMWIFYINDNGANKPSLNIDYQIEFTDF